MTRGEGWVRDVVLMISDSEVIMKEDGTQVALYIMLTVSVHVYSNSIVH